MTPLPGSGACSPMSVPRQGNLRVRLRPRAAPAPVADVEGAPRRRRERRARPECECGNPRGPGEKICGRCRALDNPHKARPARNIEGALLVVLAGASGPQTVREITEAGVQPRDEQAAHSRRVQLNRALPELRAEGLVRSERIAASARHRNVLSWSITDEGRAWLALLVEAGSL